MAPPAKPKGGSDVLPAVRRSHLWFGLVSAVAVIVICLTGILLNHRDAFGLRDRPKDQPTSSIEDALSIDDMMRGAVNAGLRSGMELRGNAREINRMMYRPGSGTTSVRLYDRHATDVVLHAATGRVLSVAPRHDLTLEHMHSGERVGQHGVILSDLSAVILIGLAVGGIWLWLARVRHRSREARRDASTWVTFNRRLHLIGGVGVSALLIWVSVTGVLLNHKRELGLMVEPVRILESEQVGRVEFLPLAEVARIGREGARLHGLRNDDEIRWIDYRPLAGYAKVRFMDEHEVVVDVYDGQVYSAARRWDVIIEQMHSGEFFGSRWVLVTDVVAALVILLTLNGLYLWVRPAWRSSSRASSELRRLDRERDTEQEQVP